MSGDKFFQGEESDRLRVLLLCRVTIDSCLNQAESHIERGEPEPALHYLNIAREYATALFWQARYPGNHQ